MELTENVKSFIKSKLEAENLDLSVQEIIMNEIETRYLPDVTSGCSIADPKLWEGVTNCSSCCTCAI